MEALREENTPEKHLHKSTMRCEWGEKRKRRRRRGMFEDEREMFYPRWLSICPCDRVGDQVLFRLKGG